MKAIVIGGGIGGLTAAIALQRVGVEAHVYERASALHEVGAGISLWTNATRALEYLGLSDAVRARSLSNASGSVLTWRGARLSAVSSDELEKRQGIAVAVLHRADLLALLLREIASERIHLGHECAGLVDDANGVTVHFAKNDAVRGDVLVGADGLQSAVRAQLFGNSPPRYAGYTAWRCVGKFARPGLEPSESWGPGQRFGIVPMRDGRVYWYATKNTLEGERDSPGQTKKNLMELFRGWHDPIEALLEASEEPAILRNDIYDRDPLPGWSKNRVTLLGDSAHPMTPNLGQGGCQAIEDAVVLAACLATNASVSGALLQYERRRLWRTRKIVLSSRRIGNLAQAENPLLCFLRNAILRTTPRAVAVRQLKSLALHEALMQEEQDLLRARDARGGAGLDRGEFG